VQHEAEVAQLTGQYEAAVASIGKSQKDAAVTASFRAMEEERAAAARAAAKAAAHQRGQAALQEVRAPPSPVQRSKECVQTTSHAWHMSISPRMIWTKMLLCC
jgi:hypothetical protein